jgi:hypothetical protein
MDDRFFHFKIFDLKFWLKVSIYFVVIYSLINMDKNRGKILFTFYKLGMSMGVSLPKGNKCTRLSMTR